MIPPAWVPVHDEPGAGPPSSPAVRAAGPSSRLPSPVAPMRKGDARRVQNSNRPSPAMQQQSPAPAEGGRATRRANKRRTFRGRKKRGRFRASCETLHRPSPWSKSAASEEALVRRRPRRRRDRGAPSGRSSPLSVERRISTVRNLITTALPQEEEEGNCKRALISACEVVAPEVPQFRQSSRLQAALV